MVELSQEDNAAPPQAPWVRFDSTVEGGSGLVLAGACGVLEAKHLEDVTSLLVGVEEASNRGLWAAGFLSYEAATGLDPALHTYKSATSEPFADLPLAWFALFERADVVRAVKPTQQRDDYSMTPWLCDLDFPTYKAKLENIRDQIAAGNTYQCNLTTRLRSSLSGNAFAFYQDLARAQRSKYCAYIDTGRFAIASASPELFFDWSGDTLTTRPMKGTSRRGRWLAEDVIMAAELQSSEKDRAENLMIVDLLRNDLGRIAEFGSVSVPSLLDLERYETVWQLTSTITARTQSDTRLLDVFGALFPCGSVTGVPKSSTMSLITKLEDSPRGVYCGAIGLVGPTGSSLRARFSVAIRTVVVDRHTDEAVYGTGGAVTWDSSAEGEYEELLAKAAVLAFPSTEFQLIETMGFRPEAGFANLDGHLARLHDSARYFDFPFNAFAIRSALNEAVETSIQACRVRLLLSRSGTLTVDLGQMPKASTSLLKLALDLEPLQSSEVWRYHKTTIRDQYQERFCRHLEVDDVLMVNERGELTEATTANLVIFLDGKWWTPPIDVGCLPGIERERLLREGVIHERVLGLQDLFNAEGMALISSLRGWRNAMLTGGHRPPKPSHG